MATEKTMIDKERKRAGVTLSSRQCEAIEALLNNPSVSEAARAIGMPTKKLARLLEDPVFDAEYEAATRAAYNHQMTCLRQGATLGVKSAVKIMHMGGKLADRLKAAHILIRLAADDKELREFAVAARKLELALRQAPVSASDGAPARAPGTGHGARSAHKRKQAIGALLAQRTLADAARATGDSVQTLCRWLNQPAFRAEFAAAARAVWGEAMMIVRRQLPQAITLQKNFMVDPAAPDAIHLQALSYVLGETKVDQMAGLRDRIAKLTGADDEPAARAKTIPRSLYRKVQRLKDGLRQATGPAVIAPVFMHAVDGRPAGTSVRGPDGRRVWLDPPPGCRAGELVEEEAA
jgi:hypothetical protein